MGLGLSPPVCVPPPPPQTLADRKRKWQAERLRRDEEVEEVRRSSQEEVDGLRAQLRKARSSHDGAASEQVVSHMTWSHVHHHRLYSRTGTTGSAAQWSR